MASILAELLQTYSELDAPGEWKKSLTKAAKANQIVALLTEQKKFNTKLAKFKSTQENLKARADAGAGGQIGGRFKVESWRTKHKGEFMDDPKTGKKMVYLMWQV